MNRASASHDDIVRRLNSEGITLGPITLRPADPGAFGRLPTSPDAVVDAHWQDRSARFVIEARAASTPKVLQTAMLHALHLSYATGLRPMVVVPYLSEASLATLEQHGVSGVDLCGNGLVLTDGMRIWEAGHPNTVREAAEIRNPYRGDTSIFVRAFLVQRRFSSLKGLRECAAALTMLRPDTRGALTLGTASKAVSALTDELIVAKDGQSLALVDPARLMAKLREGYQPRPAYTIIGKTPLGRDEVWARLAAARREAGLRYAATGIASAAYHAVLSGVDRLSLYTDDVDRAAGIIAFRPGRAFANVELVLADKHVEYFDLQPDADALWASPIQTWLELGRGGERERDAAATMDRRLLERCGSM